MSHQANIKIVADKINTATLTPNFINPESRFIVVTYWWGRGNENKNLQFPCPEDIVQDIKDVIEEELADEDPEWKTIYEHIGALNKIRHSVGLNSEQTKDYKQTIKQIQDYLTGYYAKPETRKILNDKYNKIVADKRASNEMGPLKTFEMMIDEWETACKAMKCNYMATEIQLDRSSYQYGINAKPIFIRRVLDMLAEQGKGHMGVLYIDGDMFIRKYPVIFDTQNIDFMARNWNCDPRSAEHYRRDICFDPYIFETSGGTMFFGNSEMSRLLIDNWVEESGKDENAGKADDRILSLVYTTKNYGMEGTVIQLPIEYLWLTDSYKNTFKDHPEDGGQDRAIIEHPACLTGEERAADLSQSVVSRQPLGYTKQIEERIICETRGGVLYEFIFFPNVKVVESFEPYLTYMRNAVNFKTNEPLFEIVPYNETYGRYTQIADENDRQAQSKISSVDSKTEEITLPINAPIVDILAALLAGKDVIVGSRPTYIPLIKADFIGRNLTTTKDPYHKQILLDVNAPMFIGHENLILIELLKMCKTLDDINIHLSESYMFLSRIRWALKSTETELIEIQQQRLPGTLFEPSGIKRKTPRGRGKGRRRNTTIRKRI